MDNTSSGGRSTGEIDPLRDLIDAARNGDEKASGELVELCREYLLHVANRELPKHVQAKVAPSDLVQETLMDAHRGIEQFLGTSRDEFFAWLRRILHNNAVDAERRFHQAEKRDVSRELPLDDDDSQRPQEIDIPAVVQTPSEEVTQQEDQAQMERAIASLSDDYRQVLELHHRGGMTFEQVGEQMNRSSEAARKLWVRAIAKLRTVLEKDDAAQG